MDDPPAAADDAPSDARQRPGEPPEGLPPPPPTNEAYEGSGVRFGGAAAPDEALDRRRLRRRGQDPTIDRGIDSREMWRIFRINSEIVEGLDRLREIRPAITIWGSARLAQDHTHCRRVFDTSKRLAEMGYSEGLGWGSWRRQSGGTWKPEPAAPGRPVLRPRRGCGC